MSTPFQIQTTARVFRRLLNSDDSYTYPDANNGGRWRTTNPKPEIEAIRDRNNACNGNLVPLCRMMRAWKSKRDVPIGGLLIDTLAYQFIDDWKYKDKSFLYYDYMCRDFFCFMADQDKDQEYWLALGSGQRVYGKGLFQWKAKRCYNISLEAIEHETANPKREWSAKQKWEGNIWNLIPRLMTLLRLSKFLKDSLESVFGRVVYSHKTHEKCADILLKTYERIKLGQIILSAITTAGFVSVFFGEGKEKIGLIVASLVSAILLCLNLYQKNYNLAETAQNHKQAANDLWLVRGKVSIVNHRFGNWKQNVGSHTGKKRCFDGRAQYSLL